MAQVYEIRTADGLLIAVASGSTIDNLPKHIEGTWEVYHAKGKRKTVCYRITRAGMWEFILPKVGITLFLFEGTKVIKV